MGTRDASLSLQSNEKLMTFWEETEHSGSFKHKMKNRAVVLIHLLQWQTEDLRSGFWKPVTAKIVIIVIIVIGCSCLIEKQSCQSLPVPLSKSEMLSVVAMPVKSAP